MSFAVRQIVRVTVITMVLCLVTRGASAQTPVELELVLAVDTSASVSNDEYVLQMVGIADAFRHPEVLEAIMSYGASGIAVTLVQWSAGDQQAQSIGWHHVSGIGSAERLARAIEGSPRAFGVNTTAIGSALRFSVRLFSGNGFAGRRQTVDVSGDGRNNAGLVASTERDRAVAAGVTVNGLAILNGDLELERYYRINVMGGPRSFVDTADDFADFARAIRDKLIREISPIVAQGPPSGRRVAGTRQGPKK